MRKGLFFIHLVIDCSLIMIKLTRRKNNDFFLYLHLTLSFDNNSVSLNTLLELMLNYNHVYQCV